jgi:diadenosine tetraphosphatase ApaH/serine/threonine PP2A family protein phosphatase
MRIGIFSDVHGNIDALTNVLKAFEQRGVDEYVCLGDIIGYGADPEPCVQEIRRRCSTVVLGNHDAAGSGRMELDDYYQEAKDAIIYAWGRLGSDDREWLRGLPMTARRGDTLYCHGAPHAPELYEYLFSEEQADAYRFDFPRLPPVTFIGHSHLTVGFDITAEMVNGFVLPEVAIERGHKYVFTVGSVGQPRDRDNRACGVIHHVEERRIEYVRVPYDIAGTQKRILAAGLPPNFASRLAYGM